MPLDVPARVIGHETISPDHFLLTLEAGAIARNARAGQFVMLQVRQGRDPLLRRPMSIYRVLPGRHGRIQILYKVVGEGTRHLSRQRVGARLPTLGPLGNGFKIRRRRRSLAAESPVLVAGGIGIAIFPFLVETLLRERERPVLLYGGRGRRDLVALDFFRARGVPVRLATEDGSAGTRGYVTRLLESVLERPRGATVPSLYVCGPTAMLRAVGTLAIQAGFPCQLALESPMPCGIGVCLGCVVRCRDDGAGPLYRRVCTEGPVFEASQVLL